MIAPQAGVSNLQNENQIASHWSCTYINLCACPSSLHLNLSFSMPTSKAHGSWGLQLNTPPHIPVTYLVVYNTSKDQLLASVPKAQGSQACSQLICNLSGRVHRMFFSVFDVHTFLDLPVYNAVSSAVSLSQCSGCLQTYTQASASAHHDVFSISESASASQIYT
jgi:hypothetical protein